MTSGDIRHQHLSAPVSSHTRSGWKEPYATVRTLEASTRSIAARPPGIVAALNAEQAAAYTGLAPPTLEPLRCTGGGSRFVRYGRKVRYLIDDLDEWMAARTVASTSEALLA